MDNTKTIPIQNILPLSYNNNITVLSLRMQLYWVALCCSPSGVALILGANGAEEQPRDAKREPSGAKGDASGAEGEPKGSQEEPNVAIYSHWKPYVDCINPYGSLRAILSQVSHLQKFWGHTSHLEPYFEI